MASNLDQASQINNVIAHTANPTHNYELEWTLDDALTYSNDIFTSALKLPGNCYTKLNALIKIVEDSSKTFSEVMVGFQRSDKKKGSIRVFYDISIRNEDGDVYLNKQSDMHCDKGLKHHYFMSAKFTKFKPSSNVANEASLDGSILHELSAKGLAVLDGHNQSFFFLLPTDVLVIKGKVSVLGCCTSTHLGPQGIAEPTMRVNASLTPSDLTHDFQAAYENGLYSDIVLNVRDKAYRAHKFVLASRSPTLRRLLHQVQGEEGQIGIDMAETTFEAFLKYLYTGIVGDVTWTTLFDLYDAAVTFETETLQHHCSKKMMQAIDQKRAYKILELAQKYKDDALKHAAINFIVENFSTVLDSKEWDEFIDSYPRLASEILKSVKRHKISKIFK